MENKKNKYDIIKYSVVKLLDASSLIIVGYIFDLTGNYDWSFHVGGVMFIFAGGLYCLLHLPVFSKKIQRAAAKVSEFKLNITFNTYTVGVIVC